tara:strand:+ start:12454 stop:12852 length:399 start_codon:yes stop_codon:yes gene_type:complete
MDEEDGITAEVAKTLEPDDTSTPIAIVEDILIPFLVVIGLYATMRWCVKQVRRSSSADTVTEVHITPNEEYVLIIIALIAFILIAYIESTRKRPAKGPGTAYTPERQWPKYISGGVSAVILAVSIRLFEPTD